MYTMQYPYAPGNQNYDGREHQISPISFVSIYLNGRQFFIMTY